MKDVIGMLPEIQKLYRLIEVLTEWGYSEQEARKCAWDAVFQRYLPEHKIVINHAISSPHKNPEHQESS